MTKKEAIRWFEKDTAQMSKAIIAVNELAKIGRFLDLPEIVRYEQEPPTVDTVPRWKQ